MTQIHIEEAIPDKVRDIILTMTAPQVSACMALVIHYIGLTSVCVVLGVDPDDIERAFIDSLRAIAGERS